MNLKLKLIFIIISLVFITGIIHAYTISDVNIVYDYGGDTTDSFEVTVTASDTTGISEIPLTIDSSKHTDTAIDFNASGSGTTFTAYFYLDFDSAASSVHNGWPKIIVNTSDTITVNDSQSKSDTMIVDGGKPTIGTFTLETLGNSYGNYYRGDVNLNLSTYSDSQTYIDHYIVYIVPVADIATYSSSYTKRVTTDNNLTEINLDINSTFSDANYYVVVDAADAAGNVGTTINVTDTNRNMYVDNSSATINSFGIEGITHTLTDDTVYYVDSNTFNFNILITDAISGVNTINSTTIITVTDPDETIINLHRDYNTDINGFYVPISDIFEDGNTYQVTFDVNDLVDNNLSYDFNITIDGNGPSTPTEPAISRTVDNNMTINSWGTATDGGSGLKEYKVYRSTSDFTTVTTQTLVCTVAAAASKTCSDTGSKSDDDTYYYGIAAVDYAGNLSLVDTNTIRTGPLLTINSIGDSGDYTNDITPDINLTYGSHVNQVRFSCNASTFTSWISVSGTALIYDEFNITYGNGCSTTDEQKDIFVEAKSEDSPFLVTRESDTIKYDGTIPYRPTNVLVTSLLNGGLKLTWTGSDDNYSGVDYYKIYYDTSTGVTASSASLTTTSTTYTYTPNTDNNYYFRISSVDEAGNESSLTSEKTGEANRFGPTFTFEATPVSDNNNNTYVKAGTVNFTVTSDENLTGNPIVKIKIGSAAYVSIAETYNNKIMTFDYTFDTSGDTILSVTGTNESSESSTDTYEFVVDVNEPDYNVTQTIVDSNYTLAISDIPDDVFRAQYLLDSITELCLIESASDYNCSFNSLDYSDGDHTISVLVYDYALNVGTKEVSITINNINEIEVERNAIITSVTENAELIDSKIAIYDELLVTIPDEVAEKLALAKEKILEALNLTDQNSVSAADELYKEVNNLLLEILDLLPEESVVKVKTITSVYDSNVDVINLSFDANVIEDTNALYNLNVISVDRNFSVQDIASQKYYSMTLEFKNNSDQEKIITFVETIPKEFAENIKDLIFNEEVEVLDADPIIMYTITIPAKSSIFLRYKNKTPITDFDVVTKYDLIEFTSPLVLSGSVTADKINVEIPTNKRLLSIIGAGLLIILIILIAGWAVMSAKKKKQEGLAKVSSKPSVNEYFGGKLNSQVPENKTTMDTKQADTSKVSTDDTFQSNYDYIINAVKRNKKNN